MASRGDTTGVCERGMYTLSLETREDRHLLAECTGTGKPVYKNGQALTGDLLLPESDTNESGRTQGIGDRAQREENRDGEAVVLADHSTDGRAVGRPRRWGTETQGIH